VPVGDGWDVAPEDRPWSDFHWWKVPAKGVLVLALLGERPVYYVGHYVDGRMWPCTGPGCGLCERGVGSQIRYVMGAVDIQTHRAGILEVGRGNGMLIRDWVASRGAMSGLIVELEKHSHSRTSRTEVRWVHQDPPVWVSQLEAPDLRRALILTWDKASMPRPPGMV
jgi:hypothetical protein